MANSILNLIENYKPQYIVVEEVAGSKNRISQKTLDMMHGILWKTIDKYLDIVSYLDVSGAAGWRTLLDIRLNDADKLANAEARKINKQLGASYTELPIIGWKDLACRYVNYNYSIVLNSQEQTTDGDIADSICLGSAWLKFKRQTT